MRDEFTKEAMERLPKRAGFMCSYPECRRLTVGPSEDRKSGLSMIGIAAHITAAAPGGARYDAGLSKAERSSESNGIWVCADHSKLIDDNASICTVDELKRWKRQHEDWVFARIANASNHVRNGISRFSVSDIGPFRATAEFKAGTHNVVYGLNASGKSTASQAIAALSGGANYAHFAERFSFCIGASGAPALEIGVSVDDVLTTVRLSQQAAPSRAGQGKTRLHIEINGNVAPHWPLALFNIVLLDERILERQPNSPKNPLERALQHLAAQLHLPTKVIRDSLREELYLSTSLGYRFQTIASGVEVLVPDERDFYLPFANLSSGQQTLAVLDILLKIIRTDPRQTPWLLILDTGFFSTLDSGTKQQVANTLTALKDPPLQTILCVNYEEDMLLLKNELSENWIGASAFGELTIHSFL